MKMNQYQEETISDAIGEEFKEVIGIIVQAEAHYQLGRYQEAISILEEDLLKKLRSLLETGED